MRSLYLIWFSDIQKHYCICFFEFISDIGCFIIAIDSYSTVYTENNCNNLFQLSSNRNVTFISYIEHKPPLISQNKMTYSSLHPRFWSVYYFNTYNLWQTNYIIYVDKIVKVCPFPRIITGIKLSSCPKKIFLTNINLWT